MRGQLTTRFAHTLDTWMHERRSRRYAAHYERVLGTSLELQLTADDASAARRAEAAVLAEIDRLERILSGWSSTSELARWMATRDEDVSVTPELAELLLASEAWRERTGGAFDPAAQAVIDALRDGRDVRDVLEAMRAPRWAVDRDARTARRLTPLAISLDAIAKGFIVTRAVERARAVPGISGVLLNIGGDVQHVGARGVAVGIASPFAPAENEMPIAVVRIANEALATSGGYRRGFIADGRRVSHLVDPRTAQPVERIASASVFARDCATADALSTAFSVLAPHESMALADALPGVGCLLVTHDRVVTASRRWAERTRGATWTTTSRR